MLDYKVIYLLLMSINHEPYDRLVCNPIFPHFKPDFERWQREPGYEIFMGEIRQFWTLGPKKLYFWRKFDRTDPSKYPVVMEETKDSSV